MIPAMKRRDIIRLINSEVVPAIGCTEPMAVALCVARATEILGQVPARMTARLSDNIIKNAMGVGIPGTGMIGLPIAMALGALVGKSEYNLEVLRDVTPEAVGRARDYIASGCIEIETCADAPSILHIDVTVFGQEGSSARAVISGEHTRFVYLCRDTEILFNECPCAAEGHSSDDVHLDMATIYEFATETP